MTGFSTADAGEVLEEPADERSAAAPVTTPAAASADTPASAKVSFHVAAPSAEAAPTAPPQPDGCRSRLETVARRPSCSRLVVNAAVGKWHKAGAILPLTRLLQRSGTRKITPMQACRPAGAHGSTCRCHPLPPLLTTGCGVRSSVV